MQTGTEGRPGTQDIRPSIVSFLDILGYRRIMEDREGSVRLFNAVADIVDDVHGKVGIFSPEGENPASIAYRLFSDNVTVSCGYNPRLRNPAECWENATAIALVIHIQAELQMRLLTEHSLLVTGGIALGDYFRNDRFVFGKGLVEAYELQTEAKAPRTLVDERVVDVYVDSARKAGLPVDANILGRMFMKDDDGRTYVHYLYAGEFLEGFLSGRSLGKDELLERGRALLDKHRSGILRAVEENRGDIGSNEGIAAKYQWAIKYHNDVVGMSGFGERIDPSVLYE